MSHLQSDSHSNPSSVYQGCKAKTMDEHKQFHHSEDHQMMQSPFVSRETKKYISLQVECSPGSAFGCLLSMTL